MPASPSSSLVEAAVRGLREEILDGRLAPGARVHLAEAAGRLGMSMVPIREALRSLVTEGLVVSIPQRGYRVSEVSLDDLRDIYLVRLELDPMATALAVERMTPQDVAAVERAFDGLVAAYAAGDRARHTRHHRDFHFAIYGPCGSPWLLRFLTQLWENSYRYQRMSSARRGSLQDRADEHRRILESVKAGRPQEAAQRMREHLELTLHSAEALADDAAASIEPAA